MKQRKRGKAEDKLDALRVDMTSLIDQNSKFFDKLVELIPAKFYLPLDENDKVWFPGLSKTEKFMAKKESKENIKKARRDRLDPEKSSTTTLDLLRQNIEYQKEDDESNDEVELEINPNPMVMEHDDSSRSQSATYEDLRERLRLRIEELRAARNADTFEGVSRVKIGSKGRKKDSQEKKRKRDAVLESDFQSVKVEKDVAEAAKELTFTQVKLGNGKDDGKRRTKRKVSKLKELEKAKSLAASKLDPEKGEAISKKVSWNNAMSRAAGIKVHDNPKLLERSIKKEKKRQQKHAEKWKERIDAQQKSKADKQQVRSKNIQDKINQKKMRKIAKREKKLMRPGFEGRKEGYINQT